MSLSIDQSTSHRNRSTQASLATGTLHFLREQWVSVLSISLLVQIPCYWHRWIEAGDLGSHTYNAWLALLVTQGKAPGLYLARQWNNVIVDSALTWLGGILGFLAAERIVVSVCVLVFFWGAFALIAASTLRKPWFLTPAIGMVTYGYTFYAGFMNFYLSLGLAFLATAVFWRGNRTDWMVGLVLAFLSLMAHPMGFGLLTALVVYVLLAQSVEGWRRWLVFAGGLVALLGLHFSLRYFRTEPGLGLHFVSMNGADQLVLFGERYRLLAEGVVIFGSCYFLAAAIQDWKRFTLLKKIRTPLELWVLAFVAAAVWPGAIWLPQYTAAVSSIASRLTAVTAVLGLCILASVEPRKWGVAGVAVCAAIFFVFQYQDTGILNKMDRQVESLVRKLPYGTRVSYTIDFGKDSRINFRHMVDRACIGQCFTYSNYEPGTGQFRIRLGSQGSPIVSDSGLSMEQGTYVVRAADLPMAQIYQPDESDLTKLSIRNLSAGEENGGIGHRAR